jgi:fructose-specific phosphotransferase system IIC component
MEAGQEIQEGVHHEEEASEETLQPERQVEQEEYVAAEEATKQDVEQKNLKSNDQGEDRSGFINGLAVGLGVGCITTFVIMWIAVFFTPLLPSRVTYEILLSIFIYPLIYLLAVGLIALTAGVVREYYARRS